MILDGRKFRDCEILRTRLSRCQTSQSNEFLGRAFTAGADAVWILDQNGNAVSGGVICDNPPEVRDAQTCIVPGVLGKQVRVLQSGIEIWEAGNSTYSGARIPIKDYIAELLDFS